MTRPLARLASSACAIAVFPIAITVGARLGAPVDPAAAERALVAQAAGARESGRYAEALDPTLALAALYPSSHVYKEQLATLYHGLDRPKEEAEAWEQFVALSPAPSEACPAIIDAYRAQSLVERAIDASDRCLLLAPDDPDMMFYAARAAEWSGRLDRASDLYQRALAVDDRNLDVQIGLARVDLHRHNLAGALDRARAVLATSPRAVDAVLVVALALQQLDRPAEARQAFEQGLALKETYPDLHLGLAIVEEGEGRVDDARRHYERALAIDPSRSDIRTRLTRLEEVTR